ncbi:MAG: [protein-PII] uridylyltransferase [Acidobacteria bacterium]|nr:[protein-PII] uridylyltransferase [Acidobacteriota bacterium]
MKVDLQQILQRAEQRLGGVSEATAEESLRLMRSFLKMESHRLRMLHRYGLTGWEVASSRAQVVDAIIIHAYRMALARYPDRDKVKPANLAVSVIAVGGYGRGELCPESDVDLLILHNKQSDDFGKFMAHELVYLLWDINLKVGHSYRTAQQCLAFAMDDASAENALLDARLLTGSKELCDELLGIMARHWAGQSRKFVERKQEEIRERYGKLGETVFLLEPNVKESPGGQRDYHMMHWLARGAWQLPDAEGLVGLGVLSKAEFERARRGYDWILRVRNDLHYTTGRRIDQLNFAAQSDVARNLGFAGLEHILAQEQFMRQYFLHAEHVHQALRQTLAAALREKGKRRQQVLVELPQGLNLLRTDGELRLADAGGPKFPNTPADMMRVFSTAQQLQLVPGEDIISSVRTHLPLVRGHWHRDHEMASLFLKILRKPGAVAPALRAMHSSGLLGKYLPEFGHVTKLMQYDHYHRYTIDEHTLHAIGLLDEIWTNPPASMERYRAATYHIQDSAPLYLGLLFHDVGKGLGGDHSNKGAQRAIAACERLGLPAEKVAQVDLLVRQHLILSHLSQRRDLSDRRVAQQVAEVVRDEETLSMLTLLTYADTAAVAPEVWNDWKNSLLWELYEKTHLELLGREAATAQEEEQLREMRAQVSRLLIDSPATSDASLGDRPSTAELAQVWTDGHLARMPHRYPLGMRPELIMRQILLARRAVKGEPAVAFLPFPEQGFTVLLLCCPDVRGLFARVAGTLAALEVNILGARLDTRQDGIAVDMLWISTPRGDAIEEPARLRRIAATLENVLKGAQSVEELVGRMTERPAAPAHRAPRMTLNNEISDQCTVIEVLGEDRLGFAYSIATCLNHLGLNINFAKLSTEKSMAFDVFYLTDAQGKKIPEASWGAIVVKVNEALQPPAPAPPA